jgi:hypothetical protein
MRWLSRLHDGFRHLEPLPQILCLDSNGHRGHPCSGYFERGLHSVGLLINACGVVVWFALMYETSPAIRYEASE